jgi:hypothetical protein
MISFTMTKADAVLLAAVVARVNLKDRMTPSAQRDFMMDVQATHANGCPLDFTKWLSFDDFSFWHDVRGIQRHIDRQSGELRNCFLPRCAK